MVQRIGAVVGAVVVVLGGLVAVAAPGAADPVPEVQAALPPGGSFVPVVPQRVLDTRSVGGPTQQTTVDPRPALPAGGGVAAVLLNVTVVNATGAGYVTVGSSTSRTSNGNYVAHRASATLALVRLPASGLVPVTSSARADIVVDVQGYVTTPAAATTASFTPLPTPTRIADSRNGSGLTPFVGATTQTLAVRELSGVPADATAVIANVTVASATASTYVTAWSGAEARPGVSTVNAGRGDIVANRALVPLDPDGDAAFFNAGGTTNLVVDVVGYLSPDPSGSYYTPVAAGRVLDRSGTSSVVEPTVDSVVGGPNVLAPSVDDLAPTTAVWLTLVGDHPAGRGYLTARPGGGPVATSDLDLVPNRAVANAGPATLSPEGTVLVTTSAASRVVADLSGWFRAAPAPAAPGLWSSTRYPDYTDTPARTDTQLADAPGALPEYFARGVFAGQNARTPTAAYAIAPDTTVDQATYPMSEPGAVDLWRPPTRVGSLTGVTRLATAGAQTTAAVYALTAVGQVYGFQSNAHGELGTAPNGFITYPLRPTLVPLGVVATAVYAAQGVGYAVGLDGTVYSWGRADTGQLGRTPTATPWVPARVDALTAPIAIAGDGRLTFAVDADGGTWSWGAPVGAAARPTPTPYAGVCAKATALHADYNGVWELCDDGTVVQLSRLGAAVRTPLPVAGATQIGAGAGYDNGIRVLTEDGRVADVPSTGTARYEGGFANVTAVNGSPGVQITQVGTGG
ncbi:hypothetical protein ACXR2U_18810 [Jatrophihabitans sp. YIM 134969]